MVSLSIVICIVTYSNIEKAKPLEPAITIGSIGYEFSQLALYLRLYDLNLKNNLTSQFNISFIEDIIQNLDILKDQIDSASEYFDFFKESKSLLRNELSISEIPLLYSHKKINLYDYVVETTKFVKII